MVVGGGWSLEKKSWSFPPSLPVQHPQEAEPGSPLHYSQAWEGET